MMQPSESRRSSTLFGDAPSLYEVRRKDHKYRLDQRVLLLGFWFWFRKTLPLTAPLLLVGSFLIPYFLFDNTDGYIFVGGILSIVFCSLAVLSYFHITPWRRHPSSLMVQICLMSIAISIICILNAYPTGYRDFGDASDINLMGSPHYRDSHDHLPRCILMSFFIQLTLLAREMWILTLSLDLMTSITNPFASYTFAVRKYHGCIWLVATVSAITLVSEGSCQGEFLNNGTCWLKISGVGSWCFWGYFMSWVIIFYINALAVLFYAYTRISKGLESTYATRYACVADTFRIVFFYFFYGLVLAGMFMGLYYSTKDNISTGKLYFLEHCVAYLIACRGFFDALVWFFSHGFSSGTDSVTNMNIHAQTLHSRRLFMDDVIQPRKMLRDYFTGIAALFYPRSNKAGVEEDLTGLDGVVGAGGEGSVGSGSARISSSTHEGGSHGLGDDLDEDEANDHLSALLLGDELEAASPDFVIKSRSKHISFKAPESPDLSRRSQLSGSTLSRRNTGSNLQNLAQQVNTASRDSQARNSSSASYANSIRQRMSELDVSPQLNLALRQEVLELVTQGIKESVMRLNDREKKRMMSSASPSMRAATQTPGDSMDQDGSMRSNVEDEEFVRVRLSNSSDRVHPQPAASKPRVLMDIFGGSLYQPSSLASSSFRQAPASTQYSMRHPATQSKTSSKLSAALHGLMSVVGAYIPGEYGVDPINYHLEQSLAAMRSNADTSYSHHTAASNIYDDRGVPISPLIPPHVLGRNPDPMKRLWMEESKHDPAASSLHDMSYSRQSSPSKNMSHYLDTLEHLGAQLQTEQPQQLPPPPAEVIFLMNGKYPFRDFRPATFQKLRQLCNFSEEHYLEIISQPAQERLSEGRSGAFFFICGDGDIVVKTVEKREANTLLSILDQYFSHLVNNPQSLMVRFLGLHSIRMYGNEFTFVVMKNIFPPGIQLNEKYDIKGSWVQRNAQLKVPGKLSSCRYCGEQFIEGGMDKCSEVVGSHEASITLKDNDMINKIRLYPEDAFQVIEALLLDSDALCNMGLMDYSLLVGVRHSRYDVDTLHKMQHPHNHQLRTGLTDPVLNSGSRTASGASEPVSFFEQNPMSTPSKPSANQPPATGATMASNQATLHTNLTGHVTEAPTPGFGFRSTGYPARVVIAPKEYYFGVIDILETWSWSKKLERFFKVYILGQPGDGVSCIHPQDFKDRYQRKISRIIEHSNIVREVTGSWQGKREIGAAQPLVGHQEA